LFGSGLLESVNVMLAWDHIPRICVCDYNKHLTSREKKRFPWLNKIDKKGRKKKQLSHKQIYLLQFKANIHIPFDLTLVLILSIGN